MDFEHVVGQVCLTEATGRSESFVSLWLLRLVSESEASGRTQTALRYTLPESRMNLGTSGSLMKVYTQMVS